MEIKEVEDILIESEKPRKIKFDEKGELIESINIINELEKKQKIQMGKRRN
jgi:rRNA pseudouridine-1189 N-methylase Emg1 (Nep1/Mra1 family)